MPEMPDNIRPLTRQGAPTDQEVKDEAFRLWIELGRSWRLVSKQLGIEERTLYRWGKTERWEERRKEEAAAFLPGTFVESAIALRLGAHNAAVRLQQIAYEALQGVKPDPKEVQALSLIVDRGGFSPVGKGDQTKLDVRPAAAPLLAIDALTDDDLDRIERQATEAKERQKRTRVIE